MKFKKYINWLPLLLISVLGYFIYNHLSFYLKSMNKPSHHTGLLSKKLKENQTDDQDYFSFQQDGSQSALVPEIDEYSQDFVSVVPIKPTEQIEDIPLKVTSIEPVKTTQHLFKKLSKDIFSTKEERLQFFAELGLEYLNHTEFDYTPALDLDPKESDKYLADVQGYDLLSVQYADEIAAKKLIPVSVRWLGEEIGHGIFAEKYVPAGGFIGIYGGVVKDRKLVKDRDYAWAYPGKTLEGTRITLDGVEKSNELRFVNDGRDPNCIVKYIIGNDRLWHVCYIAAKDIKKGDQLLISYGPAYWDTRQYKYQELAGLEQAQ